MQRGRTHDAAGHRLPRRSRGCRMAYPRAGRPVTELDARRRVTPLGEGTGLWFRREYHGSEHGALYQHYAGREGYVEYCEGAWTREDSVLGFFVSVNSLAVCCAFAHTGWQVWGYFRVNVGLVVRFYLVFHLHKCCLLGSRPCSRYVYLYITRLPCTESLSRLQNNVGRLLIDGTLQTHITNHLH